MYSQQGSRFPVKSSERLNQMEVGFQSFSNNVQEVRACRLFASRISDQVPTYISWKLDSSTKGSDAFQITWPI